jgi:hypothetical protein
MILPRPPAHVEPYVTALGVPLAIEFLHRYGGAPAYLAENPQARNQLLPVIGEAGIAALYRKFGNRIERVPTSKVWIAQVWHAQGRSVLDIARSLHTTDKTIRSYLKAGRLDAAAREAEREKREAARIRREAEKARQIDIEAWLKKA